MVLTTAVGLAPLQGASNGGGIAGGLTAIIYLAILVVVVAGMWKTFEKAGEPGWGALIPIYNTYLLIKIGGDPWWYLLLLFVPLVNVLVIAKVSIDVAKGFDQGIGFGLALWILPFIFYPLLGFGEYEYVGAP